MGEILIQGILGHYLEEDSNFSLLQLTKTRGLTDSCSHKKKQQQHQCQAAFFVYLAMLGSFRGSTIATQIQFLYQPLNTFASNTQVTHLLYSRFGCYPSLNIKLNGSSSFCPCLNILGTELCIPLQTALLYQAVIQLLLVSLP